MKGRDRLPAFDAQEFRGPVAYLFLSGFELGALNGDLLEICVAR